jgi:tRNA (mo5U34)-methyltransferase
VKDADAELPRIALPDRLDGLTVLDVGANDGFFSFECERRGARRVVAFDHPDWSWANRGWGSSTAFDLAHELLVSKVEKVVGTVETLSPEQVGSFDWVLCMGIVYHLPDVVGPMRNVVACLNPGGSLVLETQVDGGDGWRLLREREINDDPTNWWVPSPAGLTVLLGRLGLTNVRHVSTFPEGGEKARGVFHAMKPADA